MDLWNNYMYMKISVITVCFNSGETIEDCLQSVVKQRYDNVEHIIIDGGSSDNTHSILNQYKSDLSHLVIEKDDGIYDAMNKGIQLSSGDVICLLNSDDVFASDDVLSRVALEFTQHPRAEALLSNITYVDMDDLWGEPLRIGSTKHFAPWHLRFGFNPPHPGLFLRSYVYKKYGLFELGYSISADYEYIVRLFVKRNINYVKTNIHSVIMREGGVSSSGWSSAHIISKEMVRACLKNSLMTNYLLVSLRLPIKLVTQVWLRKINIWRS